MLCESAHSSLLLSVLTSLSLNKVHENNTQDSKKKKNWKKTIAAVSWDVSQFDVFHAKVALNSKYQ